MTTYDRSAYTWYTKDGIPKRFITPPDETWTKGRVGFAKPTSPNVYAFETDSCVPARSRYSGRQIAVGRVGMVEASRICEQFQGPRPRGLVCRHICENDSGAPNGFICCNPRHIKWDTQAANVADVITKGKHISQTHKPTLAMCSAGGKAATAKVQVCERCGHTGKLPSFGWHKRTCV
jgi:hypothetical protein